MKYLETGFGKMPMPDEFIPRKIYEQYVTVAKGAWQDAWQRGVEYTPLTMEQFYAKVQA